MEAEYQLNARIAQNKQLHLQNQQYKIRFMSVILLLFGLVIILVLIVSYYKNKRSLNMREMELKERHIRNILQEQELKTVNAALEGKDQERTRIARELHDRLGYILALAKLNFSSLQEDLSRVQNESAERLIRINEMLDEASMEVRRISHDLYGSSVFNFGITTALHQLAEAVSAANKIQVRFHSQYVPSDIRLELQVSVYRIVGELISNSLKHAKPSQIDIQLFGRAGELVLTYEDDGNGFDTEDDSWKSGMGYSNIEARLKKYKGSYIVESAPGRGMYFQAEFPSIYLDPEA
jgi:signal transduction histidine kinase